MQSLDLKEGTVPHLKDLIHVYLELEAQCCGMTFNVLCWLKVPLIHIIQMVLSKQHCSSLMMISRLSSGRVRSTHCQILVGADAPVTPIITRSLQICLPMSPDPPAG